MTDYDVVVVGAGPAGGQCARELCQKGIKVLLIDKAKSFLENNYSSGGAPLDILQEYQLPASIAGSFWNTLRVHSTKAKAEWKAHSPFGPVIDFDQLRKFLADEVYRHNGKLQLGCQYLGHSIDNNGLIIRLKDLNSQNQFDASAKVLVDATGSERKVLMNQLPNEDKAMIATGIEYHIETTSEIYAHFASSMNFFLGHNWMPQGYGWIFSMAPNKLKVGVIRYYQNQKIVPYIPSYKHYLEKLLALCGSYRLLDRHGKTIHYTKGQTDLRTNGPVLAIGDAISSINPLGCEGIRHALASGKFAALAIEDYLSGRKGGLKNYEKSIQKYFGWKWMFSEWLADSLFKTRKDELIDHSVKSFSSMNNQEIMDVIFNYRFRYAWKSYLKYFFGG